MFIRSSFLKNVGVDEQRKQILELWDFHTYLKRETTSISIVSCLFQKMATTDTVPVIEKDLPKATDMFYYLLISTLLLSYIYWRLSRKHMLELAEKLPGPDGLPFLGNALDLLGSPSGKRHKDNCTLNQIQRQVCQGCEIQLSTPTTNQGFCCLTVCLDCTGLMIIINKNAMNIQLHVKHDGFRNVQENLQCFI